MKDECRTENHHQEVPQNEVVSRRRNNKNILDTCVNTGELVHTARSKDAFVPVNRARHKMCFIYSKSESMAWPLAA